MDLYYLIYTSMPAKLMSDAELAQLLEVAREANNRFEVTGMLLCFPESFIQLIEGAKPHIDQLYKNIRHDQRHFRVTTLQEGHINRRFFPDWAMAFEKRDPQAAGKEVISLQDDKVLQLFNILEA